MWIHRPATVGQWDRQESGERGRCTWLRTGRYVRKVPRSAVRNSAASLVLLIAVSCCGVHADESMARPSGPEVNPLSPWYLSGSERRWHLDGLVGAELEPDYVGSDDSEIEPAVSLRGHFRDGFGNRYTLGLGEIGIAFPLRRWAFTADFEYEEGRETENAALAGLPDGDATLEGEFALFRRFGDGYGFVVFQPDLLGRGKGIVYFVGYAYDFLSRDGRWRWTPSLDVSWGDREHMQTEFGLTEAEAAIIGQRTYTLGSGLKSATAGIAVERRFGRRWSLVLGVEAEKYFSEAADSPLLSTLGSDLTFEATTGLFLRF